MSKAYKKISEVILDILLDYEYYGCNALNEVIQRVTWSMLI